MQIRDPKSFGIKISLQPENLSKSPLLLEKNELISGQVLKLLPEGKATLLIKGRQVIAKSPFPLTQGSLLSFKVENTSPFPILKLMGTTFRDSGGVNVPMVMSAIKENLWKVLFENVGQYGLPKGDLTRFRALMNDLTWRLPSKSKPDSLKGLIAKSGLGWEAKLRKVALNGSLKGADFDRLLAGDLKGMVSRWLALQEKEEVLLKRFVSAMKNTQLLNLTSPDQDRKIFLPIPILLPQGIFTVAQLLILIPQRGGRSSSGKKERDLFRISFLLEMSRMGPMRVDLTIKGKEITGQFIITTAEAKSILERNLPLFLSGMEEKGFKMHQMTCKLKDPEKVTKPLIDEIIQEGKGYMSLFA
jgi:Flagellar hook-length control protein FliK